MVALLVLAGFDTMNLRHSKQSKNIYWFVDATDGLVLVLDEREPSFGKKHCVIKRALWRMAVLYCWILWLDFRGRLE